MTDQCYACGDTVHEWQLNESDLCRDCADEYLYYLDDDTADFDAGQSRKLYVKEQ